MKKSEDPAWITEDELQNEISVLRDDLVKLLANDFKGIIKVMEQEIEKLHHVR